MRHAAAVGRRQQWGLIDGKGYPVKRGASRAFVTGRAHYLNLIYPFVGHFLQAFQILLLQVTLDQVAGGGIPIHSGGPRFGNWLFFHHGSYRQLRLGKVFAKVEFIARSGIR